MPQVRCHSLADKCARLMRGDGVGTGAPTGPREAEAERWRRPAACRLDRSTTGYSATKELRL